METGSNDQNPQPHTPHRKLAPHQPISVAAIHEGGALAGHPPVNRLYVWWARRPPAVSRATVAASLLNADAVHDRFIHAIGSTDAVVSERRALDAIQTSVQWSNVAFSNKRAFIHNLAPDRRRWFQDNLAVPDPVVLDVTAAGGSIPFEAGRLGLRTIANELNPFTALILRAAGQWPQQHGPVLLAEYQAVNDRFLQRVRQLIDDNAVYPPEPDYPQPAAESDDRPENKNFTNPTVSRLWRANPPVPQLAAGRRRQWPDIRRPKEYAHTPNRKFRTARAVVNSDHIAARLESNRERRDAENILPDELVPALGSKTDTLQQYDMPTWRNLFNLRRLLAHGCCVPAFRDLVDADRDAGRMTDIRKAAWRWH